MSEKFIPSSASSIQRLIDDLPHLPERASMQTPRVRFMMKMFIAIQVICLLIMFVPLTPKRPLSFIRNLFRKRGQYIRLWEGNAPGWKGKDERIPGPHTPTLEYFPANPNSKFKNATVVVLPGGGYKYLSSRESYPPCEWLTSIGFSCFILYYRVDPYTFPYPQMDFDRAMLYVNSTKEHYGHRQIGVIGFSAGGHLAAFTNPGPSVVPDFRILVYPVVSFDRRHGDQWRVCNSLLPDDEKMNPSDEILRSLSVQHWMTAANMAPAFLCHGRNDVLVPKVHSEIYVKRALEFGVNVTTKYLRGRDHGFGVIGEWTMPCEQWLEQIVL